MIYVIDHRDSFTYNVVHQFSLFDQVECDNYNNVNKIKLNKAETIVFSPGPGNPNNYPLTSKIYNQFKGKKKSLGFVWDFNKYYLVKERKLLNKIKFIMVINLGLR